MLLLLQFLLSCVHGFLISPAGSSSPAARLAKQLPQQQQAASGTPRAARARVSQHMLLNGWGSNPFALSSSSAASKKRADGLDTDVVICGTGIAGLVLAADLERRGVDYLVVEKAR